MALSVSPLVKTPIGAEEKFFRSIGDASLDDDIDLLEGGSQEVVDSSLFGSLCERKAVRLNNKAKQFVDSFFYEEIVSKRASKRRRVVSNQKVGSTKTQEVVKGIQFNCQYIFEKHERLSQLVPHPVKYQYPFGDAISCGGYGLIYLSKDENGKEIVLKVSLKEGSKNDQEFVKGCIIREAAILRRLKGCKYFVQIIDSYDHQRKNGEIHHVIAMEYLPKKIVEDAYVSQAIFDPRTNMMRSKSLSTVSAYMFAKQFLEALVVLSDKRIVHLDICPNNVFWDGNELKIFDFSVGRFLDERRVIRKDDDEITDVPFWQYRSIEKILGLDQGPKDDLWSFILPPVKRTGLNMEK